MFSLNINADGVTTNVRNVAKSNPNTIAVDNCTHHWVSGEPLVISLDMKSTFVIVTIGNNPSTVVVVVSKTGLSLCAPVLIMASLILDVLVFKKSNVSINIILLFTTIPARAITPTPDITIPNG